MYRYQLDHPVGGVYFGGGVYDPRAALRRDHTDDQPTDEGAPVEGECRCCGMDEMLTDDGLCHACLNAETVAAEELAHAGRTLALYASRARRALMEYQAVARQARERATGREVLTYDYVRSLAESCVMTLDRAEAYRANPNYDPPANPSWFPTDEELERWR